MKKSLLTYLLLLLTFGFFLSQESADIKSYRATAEKKTALVHTKLKVNFNFTKEIMNGEAWITAKPYFYNQSTLELDAKSMDILQVKINNNVAKYTYINDILTIELGKSYSKEEKYTVYIKYIANPNKVKQKGSAAISDAKGLYFINPRGEDENKPTQIWTQGETESSSCWFPTIDKPNQKTSEEIYITVPDKYITLSNGELKTKTKNSDGTRTDYWKFDKKHAPYLFFMGIGEYAVIHDKWKNIPVDYYVEKEYADVAKDIFGLTPEMIEFFSNKLKFPFAWNKYAQIFGRDYISGAMENTTAVIHGTFFQKKKGFLVDENIGEYIIAHELFHHWFGNLVTAESWSNITVNESFANYSEYLWFEYKYGKEAAEYHRNKENEGYLNGNNFDKDLVRFHYSSREDMFDGVSYNKGGAVLHMLRNYLGDDAFFSGLTKYLTDNQYKAAEAQQLRLALEEVSGKDLNWFFNQWYYANGHPKLKIINEYNPSKKEVAVTILQNKDKLFQFPFAIDVYENNKPIRQRVWVNAQEESKFIFPANSKPNLVISNADEVLLCEIEETKTIEDYIYQFNNSKEYIDKLQSINNLANAQSKDKNALSTLIKGLNDPFFRTRLDVLNNLDMNNPDVVKAAISTLLNLAKNDPKTLVQAAALENLNANVSNDYKDLYLSKVNSPSNSVKAQAIIGLSKIDPDLAKKYISSLDEDAFTSDLLYYSIDDIIANNKEEKANDLAQIAVFYEFTKMKEPEKGAQAEKAFNWIMEKGFKDANNITVTILKQGIDNYKDNTIVINSIKKTIQNGVLIKKTAINNGAKNSLDLQTQITDLESIVK